MNQEDVINNHPKLFEHVRYLEVGEGWLPLINELADKLEPMCNEMIYATQVKEKFGTLRFYMSGYTEDADRLIAEAEKKSAKICELCGKEGKIIKSSWIVTRCERC